MDQNETKIVKFSEKYNYKNKLDGIITRVENNHFKWYVILITLFLSNITTNAGLINIKNYDTRIICLCCILVSYLIVNSVALYNSNKYLIMGRCFRALEKVSNEKQNLNNFNWKSKSNKDTNKWGFVQISSVIIFLASFIQGIMFIFLSAFQIN